MIFVRGCLQGFSKFVKGSRTMNLTIHVQGHGDNKDAMHFFVTRGGFEESQFSRAEFRELVRTLNREAVRLAQVKTGQDLTVEVYLPKHQQSL